MDKVVAVGRTSWSGDHGVGCGLARDETVAM